jgi:hypothetical protein
MINLIESFNRNFGFIILVVGSITGIVTIVRIILYVFGGENG